MITLHTQLEELQEELETLELMKTNFQFDDSDFKDSYNDMLDECYPEVFNISPSRILLECDPIAYGCGLSDYVDGLEIRFETSCPEEYQRIEELKEEIEELEEQIKEMEEEDN